MAVLGSKQEVQGALFMSSRLRIMCLKVTFCARLVGLLICRA